MSRRRTSPADNCSVATPPSSPSSPSKKEAGLRRFPPLRIAGDFIRKQCLNVGDHNEGAPLSGLTASWYLSPEQHFLEALLYNLSAVIGLLIVVPLYVNSDVEVIANQREDVNMTIYWAIIFTLVCCLCGAAYQKYLTKTFIFFLQPCHVITAIFLVVTILPYNYCKTFCDVLFNIALYLIYGPILAVATPDLRDVPNEWLKANFYAHHWIIIGMPFYLVYVRAFDLFPISLYFYSIVLFGSVIYHFFILLGVSLISGANLNYIMVPLPGVLVTFGPYYRFGMTIAVFIFCILARLLISLEVSVLLLAGIPFQ